MKRITAAILLFFLAFLQGVAGWHQFERHEVCAHGELVHGASDAHGEAHGQGSHDHCNILGCFRHALAQDATTRLSQPIAHSQVDGVPPFFLLVSSPVLNEAPKTSPPRV